MLRIGLLGLSILWAVGCSGPDPLSSRLVPGSEAIIRRPPAANDASAEWRPGMVIVWLPGQEPRDVGAGTKVRVVADEEPARVHAGNPYNRDKDGEVDRRNVSIRVVEGEHDGLYGRVSRNELTPVDQR